MLVQQYKGSSVARRNRLGLHQLRAQSHWPVLTHRQIHIIVDNLSAHKSQPVKEFLEAHSKVHLHFTPTYSSWLNLVELWFGKIERDVIARGVFSSVSDLKRKLMRYIRHYNKAPRTVKWKYADPSRHISTQSVGTGH